MQWVDQSNVTDNNKITEPKLVKCKGYGQIYERNYFLKLLLGSPIWYI